MINLKKLTAGIALAGALAFSSDASAQTKNQAESDTIIYVSGPSSEPFFGAIEKGYSLAVKETGAKAEYVAPAGWDEIVQNYTRFVEAAIARKPGAIVLGNFFPDSLEPLIREAHQKGIVVVIYNSGRSNWKEVGASAFIGEEPYQMGFVAGQAASKKGVTNGICLNHVASNPTLQLRCDGYIAALTKHGGTGQTVILKSEDSTNSQAIRATVRGLLLSHNDVNGILTLGAVIGSDAVEAVADAGKEGKVRVGTIDLSTRALQLVQEGRMDFAIDQQPFLQGYYGVLLAHQLLEFGLAPVSAIDSGPRVIDQNNVADVLAVGQRFPGYRGAN